MIHGQNQYMFLISKKKNSGMKNTDITRISDILHKSITGYMASNYIKTDSSKIKDTHKQPGERHLRVSIAADDFDMRKFQEGLAKNDYELLETQFIKQEGKTLDDKVNVYKLAKP